MKPKEEEAPPVPLDVKPQKGDVPLAGSVLPPFEYYEHLPAAGRFVMRKKWIYLLSEHSS